jgi:hypothetical protein
LPQRALDRTVEAADAAHAGMLQHGVRLDQQSAEDDQLGPVGSLAERGKSAAG